MIKHTLVFFFFCIFASANDKPVLAGPEGQKAFDDLGLYYQKEDKVPPYLKQIENLNSKDSTVSISAGKYLHALLAQMFEDETNSRAVFKSQPFWGKGPISIAREFRKTVAEALGKHAKTKAAFPAVSWLLDVEKSPQNQEQAVIILSRIRDKESTSILVDILKKPHTNYFICQEALKGIIERKPDNLNELLLKFSNHYRNDLRKTAVEALKKQNVSVPAFQPEKAFTPELENSIKEISLIMKPLPDNAEFGKFQYKTGVSYGDGEGNMEEEKFDVYGWKYKEGNKIKILNWFDNIIEADSIVKEELMPISKAVTKLLESRSLSNSFDAMDVLSRKGGLTGQFQPRFISEPEIRVSVWAFQKGLKKDAARLLFPRLNNMGDERWLKWATRDLFAHPIHQEMLELFSHNRDYEETLKLAETLSSPFFKEYQYHDRAVELAKQIKVRKDVDFKTLFLPDEKMWKKIKSTMSREDQIKFHADRLRLLNCFQFSQPGGVNYRDPQSANAGYRYDKNEPVINPYNELLDMKITLAELPVLVPYLGDENFMLTFSYWRDFHPNRTFHQVNWAVAKIIDDAAKSNLSELNAYYRKNDSEKKQHIENIIDWCLKNKHLTRKELIFKTMKETEDWNQFQSNAEEALKLKYPELLNALFNGFGKFPKNQDDLMEFLCKTNSKDAVNFANSKMGKDDKVDFWASLILVGHSEGEYQKKGLKFLKNMLADKDGSHWYPRAALPLLKSNSENAKKLACEILKKERFDMTFGGSIIVHNFLLEKRKEALDFMIEGLKSEKSGRYQDSIKGDDFVEHLRTMTKKEFNFDSEWPKEKKTKAREEICQWLSIQFKAISEGKEHELIKTPPRIYHAEWMLDAP